MTEIKKGTRLVLGLMLPILMVLVIVISIISSTYLPTIFAHPRFNFLYLIDADPQPFQRATPSPAQKLYIYDVRKRQSIEVSFERAEELLLDPNASSSDDYQIVCGMDKVELNRDKHISTSSLISCYGKAPIRIMRSNYVFQIVRGVPISDNQSTFRFIGWILKDKYEKRTEITTK